MNPVLPDEAIEFGAAATKAFLALGGVDAARRAEEDPSLRAGEVASTLRALGVDDLDPRDDADSLAAAAALCEAAGRVALPYPVPSALVRDDAGRPFARSPTARRASTTATCSTSGGWPPSTGPAAWPRRPVAGSAPASAPFVSDLALTAEQPHDPRDLQLHVALVGWQVLGTVDRAVELAVEHVNGRIQFGKPIASFQAVQFQLADCAVAVAGLRELAAFTLWRLDAAPGAALVDVLALRLHAVDVARQVLRTCQQLHGAAGVCDEYDISVLTPAWPSRRCGCPGAPSARPTALADAVQGDGFLGLFEHGLAAR